MDTVTPPETPFPGPEIVVTNAVLDATVVPIGAGATLTFTISNWGDFVGNPVAQQIWVSQNSTVGDADDVAIDTDPAGAVWPGEEDDNEFEFLDGLEVLDAGVYYIWVEADFRNLVDEYDETNNLSNVVTVVIYDPATEPGALDFSNNFSAVEIYLNLDKAVGVTMSAGALEGVATTLGTDFGDRLIGDVTNDRIMGNSGDDIIKGKGGNDTLHGNEGDDSLRAGEGDDLLDGGAGDDVLIALSGADTLNGGTGDDYMYGGSGADTLTGSAGADVLRGNRGEDMLDGGAGDDDMRGGFDDDTLVGDTGDDYMLGGLGSDILTGGAGDDVMIGGRSATQGDNAEDVFVFSPLGPDSNGYDTIRGFEVDHDVIDLSDYGFSDYTADVTSLMSQRTSGVRIELAEDSIVFLSNIMMSDLSDANFIM